MSLDTARAASLDFLKSSYSKTTTNILQETSVEFLPNDLLKSFYLTTNLPNLLLPLYTTLKKIITSSSSSENTLMPSTKMTYLSSSTNISALITSMKLSSYYISGM